MTPLLPAYRSARRTILAHKGISIALTIVLFGGGYLTYAHASSTSAETRYVLGTVDRGTIVAAVTGSGQVSASNQLDIKPKVSGEITYVGVTPGQKVASGQVIARIDATDAEKAVRDAETNLKSTQLSLQKLQEPASTLSMTQAQNALTDAQDALTKLYTDSDTDVVNTFLDLPDVITGIEDVLTGTEANRSLWNMDYYENSITAYDTRGKDFRDTAYADYLSAKKSYDAAFSEYQALGPTPDTATIEQALTDSLTAVQNANKAIKSANALIQLYEDTEKLHNLTPASTADTQLAALNTYTGKANSHLAALLSDSDSLTQDKQAITEKQQALAQVQSGADSLDLQSSELSVEKAQNALTDAQNTLADYTIRAPFSGTVAAVDAKLYDEAGSSAIATLITPQQIAELSLNEVDVAKIKLGDKATLTFDAIDGLSLTGSVIAIDTIGTVSQGVVSYDVKIGFDSQDARIKPGMTVNASIITDIHQDVLTVPSSAVKSQSGTSYVLAFVPAIPDASSSASASLDVAAAVPPRSIPVEIGISDDTSTEITSGLTEGEQIVVRTVSSVKTTTSSAPSLLGGGRSASGAARGAVRIGG